MTKRNTNSTFGLLGLSIGLALGIHAVAGAQPILERLEQRIRSRIGEAQEAAQPAPPDAGEAPPVDPGPVVGQNTAPEAPGNTEPGFLGLVADDRGEQGRGVRVLATRPDGPAAKAGFQKDDLITSVAGIRVRTLADMADILDLFPPGKVVAFDVVRGQQQQRLSVTLGIRPGDPPAPAQPLTAPPIVPPPAADGLPEQPSAVGKPAPPPGDSAGSLTTLGLLRRIEALERRVAELEKGRAQ